ncbi:MAG: VWA-like domain-containing protein [Pyrobaculum sp.]
MIEEIKKKVSNAILYLTVKEPFLGTFTRLTRIVFVHDSSSIAWTNGDKIYITSAALTLSTKELAAILAHEALHIAMFHIRRMKQLIRRGYQHILINVAADAIVNHHISSLLSSSSLWQKIITCDTLPLPARRRCEEGASLEELVELLSPLLSSLDVNVDLREGEVEGETINEGEVEGETINEGEGEGEEEKGGEGREKKIIKKIMKAYTYAKMAGKVPGWAERLISEIFRPSLDWRRLLKAALSRGAGRSVRRVWTRPSRKHETYPGKELLIVRKIAVLVDTSGSIDEETLRRFVSEVYAMAEEAELIVVPWDAEVYGVYHVKRREDVKKLKLYGGGGTMITPALKLLDSLRVDKVVILSDWNIADLNDAEELLRRYARKIIAVTTDAPPPPFLHSIRLPRT